MLASHIGELWFPGHTLIRFHKATSREDTTRRQIDRALDTPSQNKGLLLMVRIRCRDSRDQRLRVRMEGIRVNFLCLCQFDNLAQVHDRNTVTDVVDQIQIMGYQEISQTEMPLEVFHQINDLGLD